MSLASKLFFPTNENIYVHIVAMRRHLRHDWTLNAKVTIYKIINQKSYFFIICGESNFKVH